MFHIKSINKVGGKTITNILSMQTPISCFLGQSPPGKNPRMDITHLDIPYQDNRH